MDPLIRAARLAPLRTRLSEAQTVRSAVNPSDAAAAAQHDARRRPEDVLREEIYKQVRAELNAQAQTALEGERELAHANGYADGLEAGRSAAATELARERERLKAEAAAAIGAMAKAQEALHSKLQSHIGDVAFAAVCSLAGEKSASPGFVLGIVEQTCAQLRADAEATARMHPRDIHTLAELLDGQELRIGAIGLKVVPDETLTLGGCLVETAVGQYDGGLEGQLRRLHSILASDAAEQAARATQPAPANGSTKR